jgi:hypothetical protein
MKNYQRINNIFGWLSFLIATTVYIICIEPTSSFWDCGEFIATAYKLEVGHPPGAPFFLLLAKLFMLFAGGDVEKIPVMVNALSAVASGFTILFLFWTITHMARKMVVPVKGAPMNGSQLALIIGSGLAGALAYTFTDSFWFSAVEGEVYATSSLFTAVVFWAMLKWENVADEKQSDRWIILIAYLMGLSIGVHLLNLLTIPALAFIYYFKKYKTSTAGVIKTAITGIFILGFVQSGVIPGLVSTAARFDLFFVNTLGLGFGSGILFYALLIVSGIVFGLYYTRKHNKPLWNTVILCFAFIIIGYSSFALIVIRSLANPPMDENNPENVFALLSYLNREQYGDRPLLKGQYYTARFIDQEKGEMTYTKGEKKYIPTGEKQIPIYEKQHTTVFPRMWSNQASHIRAYKEWGEVQGDRKPTFAQNMKFFFSYQLNFMYWRYFMWNFAGRQNDIQGDGNIREGNWLSGIRFLDEMRLGPQDNLPESMTSNKGMNKFYMLPLILGLLGLFFQYKRNQMDAWVVFLLFFLTGIAIVIYLNQTPYQPRERDYAYSGSFYAFAVWIGLGVLGIADFLMKKLSPSSAAGVAVLIGLLAGPVVLAKEGWDDHNRSHRYAARDFAYNYLNSCAPNAILFTNGDNDTFPLWYAQEVEGIRTDVRVVNLSLLNTDWYIDQMKRKAYESDPIPGSLTSDKYVQGTRDYIPFVDRNISGYTDLKEIIQFIASEDPAAKVSTQDGEPLNFYPTKKFRLEVDTAEVLRNGTVSREMAPYVVPAIEWDIDKGFLLKADIAILDLLASNNWKRPVYFAITVGSESYMNLEEYFQLEGLAYRLVPVKSPRSFDGQTGRVQSDIMYNNVINKFKWGNINDPRVYLDETTRNMTMNFRNNFARLAEKLLEEGKRDSALTALNKCLEVMPDKTVPYNVFVIRLAEMYYKVASGTGADSALALNPGVESGQYAEAMKTANALVNRMADIYEDDLHYYFSVKGRYAKFVERDMQQGMAIMQELVRLSREAKQEEVAKKIEARFNALQSSYMKAQ